MGDEWDPFADPADVAVEQDKLRPAEQARSEEAQQEKLRPAEQAQSEEIQQEEKLRPAEQALSDLAPSQEQWKIGDFVEVVIHDGPHQGNWVACQILSNSEGTHEVYIPKQPPIVEAEVVIPGVPTTLLRLPLAPANSALLRKHYLVPRPVLSAGVGPGHTGWYEGKRVVAGRKLRVLVLHGTSSNSKIMTQQIAPLKVACKADVDFIFTEGTIDASTILGNPQYALMSKVFPGQALYQFANYAAGNGFDYSDLEDVLKVLQEFMRENAPIDGVLGTGQGSNLGNLLAAQAASGFGEPLSFVVHHGATPAAWTWRFPHLFHEPLRIPSLHITGLQDPFLHGNPVLAGLYLNPETENHSEDHRPYPRDKEESKKLAARVLTFMQQAAGAAPGPLKIPKTLQGYPS